MYLIVISSNLKLTYDQIILIKEIELFITNWSYSYKKEIIFATYQRMRVNGTFWSGTSHLSYDLYRTLTHTSESKTYLLRSYNRIQKYCTGRSIFTES